MESHIDRAINGWLAEVFLRSQSEQTRKKYLRISTEFRGWLQKKGLDLDPNGWASAGEIEQAIVTLALEAQQFAMYSVRGITVARSTYNGKLNVLSSLCKYIVKYKLFRNFTNFISMVGRSRTQAYANVKIPDLDKLARDTSGINRNTIRGARNYVLIGVIAATGCRLFEAQALRWGDVRIASGRLEDVASPQEIRLALHFRRCKGGKTALHELSPHMSEALLQYLEMYYQLKPIYLDPSRPLFGSLLKHGEALERRGIQRVVKKCLDLTVHDLRHAFASALLELDVKLPEIQEKLGHESFATTAGYIHKLKGHSNPELTKRLDTLLLGVGRNV